MLRKDVDKLETLFSDKFCPKNKNCYDSRWDRNHDNKHHECKCDENDHHSNWNKKDGEWKYNDKHCECKCKKEEQHTKCEKKHDLKDYDCISSVLKQLAGYNGMLSPTSPVVYLQMKGTAGFVILEAGATGPTLFTLISFNHKTGCAKFTYESVVDQSPLIYVVDANSLSAISLAQSL